jgi:predicted ATPase
LRDARVLSHVTDEEVERVVGQSGGSPLFAEELARLAARGTNVAIAPTIEAAIQVSLDSLDDRHADAVGRLSVLGATVWHAALSELGVDDADVALSALVENEILVPHEPSRFAFSAEYQFKHTMIRDVAYARLGRTERRQLHQLAAGWLEQCGEDPAIVAGHLDVAELPERAAVYWARAARRALQTNALREALKMAERAVTFSTDPPETFRRAQLLDEVWERLDARASDRESAIAAMEDNISDALSHT